MGKKIKKKKNWSRNSKATQIKWKVFPGCVNENSNISAANI